jgi:hypothetical protein
MLEESIRPMVQSSKDLKELKQYYFEYISQNLI